MAPKTRAMGLLRLAAALVGAEPAPVDVAEEELPVLALGVAVKVAEEAFLLLLAEAVLEADDSEELLLAEAEAVLEADTDEVRAVALLPVMENSLV